MRQEDKFIIELLMPNTDWSSNEKLNENANPPAMLGRIV